MLLFLLLASASGWQLRGTHEGISLETRTVPGSAYEAIRVRKETSVPPEVQAEAIWGAAANSVPSHLLCAHVALDEAPNRRVFYEVVHAPTIAERDYVMRLERR